MIITLVLPESRYENIYFRSISTTYAFTPAMDLITEATQNSAAAMSTTVSPQTLKEQLAPSVPILPPITTSDPSRRLVPKRKHLIEVRSLKDLLNRANTSTETKAMTIRQK